MRKARHTHSNPLSGHTSLMQSGLVHARMQVTRTARSFSKVIVRSFDDGNDPGGTASRRKPIDLDTSQYDVLTGNPGLDISAYEQMSFAATETDLVNGNGHECDVAAANPSFDSTPYEIAPGAPGEEQTPQATTAPPAAAPTVPPAQTRSAASPPPMETAVAPARSTPAPKVSAQQNGSGQTATNARANSFTARQLDKLVTDENFRADLDAILGGVDNRQAKPAAEQSLGSSPATSRQPPTRRSEQASQDRTQSRTAPPESAVRELAERPSEHAIFDKIAENMQFATAYELPSINLSRRFDSFDRQGPKRSPAVRPRAQFNPTDPNATAAAPTAETQSVATSSASAETPAVPIPEHGGAETAAPNRQDVAPSLPNRQPPQLPPAPPQTLRRYSEAEMVATYGDPRNDSEAWIAENVITVQIPQLSGVPGPNGAAFDGGVAFHRLGMRSLSDLFAAWELAGLVSKVLSFDGAHARQSPHGEGTDAHAWAIAFDINAQWNPAGKNPIPMSQEGSVAELVEIANRHGFVWGGHDPRHKAGLHFELGHRI